MRTARRPFASLTASDFQAIVLKALVSRRTLAVSDLYTIVSRGSVLAVEGEDLSTALSDASVALIAAGKLTVAGDTLTVVPGKRGRPAKVKDEAPKLVAAAKRKGRKLKPAAKRKAKPAKAKGKPGRKRLYSGLAPVTSYEA